MKATILLCAAALVSGCAHYETDTGTGSPAAHSEFEKGSRFQDEMRERDTTPRKTDRQVPTRSGPGGLGSE